MALTPLVNFSSKPRKNDKVYGRKRHDPLGLKDANQRLFGGLPEGLETSTSKTVCGQKFDNKSGGDDDARNARDVDSKRGSSKDDKRDNIDHASITTALTIEPRIATHVKSKGEKRIASDAELVVLEPVLTLSRVSSVLKSFASFGRQLTSSGYNVAKLNEGSYSECFLIEKPGQAPEAVVMKVIPVDCTGTAQTTGVSKASDFLREVKLLTALETYHGFAQIFGGRLVRGQMPDTLLNAARTWLEATKEEVNKTVDPAQRHPHNQLYGIVEMAYAGQDLELLKRPSAFQAYDAFWTTAILLANAESKIEFEHRDLHMSNICFRPDADGNIDVDQSLVKSMRCAPKRLLGLSGLQISIIDYTHSRMRDAESNEILFNPESAHSAEDLARYRRKRQPCDQKDTILKVEEWISTTYERQKEDVAKFQGFTPKTNVIWLSHVLFALTKHVVPGKRQTCVPRSSAVAKDVQKAIWETLAAVLAWTGSSDLETLPDGANQFINESVGRGLIQQLEVDAFMEKLNLNSSPG